MRGRTASACLLLIAFAMSGCFEDTSADVTADFTVVMEGNQVTFDAGNSTGPVASYQWNFGDGTTGTGPLVTHDYAAGDTTWFASLVVEGKEGQKAAAFQPVALGDGENAAPAAVLGKTARWITANSTLGLDASGSHDDDGDQVTWTWSEGPWVHGRPVETTFDTGLMSAGESATEIFLTPGTYHLHCHPHPWMRSQIVVTDDLADEGANQTISIGNFQFGDGSPVTVSKGTTLRFVNEDPVEHTASVEFFQTGRPTSDPLTLRRSAVGPGDHMFSLVGDDGRGGKSFTAWGVKVSEDAPILPPQVIDQGAVVRPGEDFHHSFGAALLFDAVAVGHLTWNSTAGAAMSLNPVIEGTDDVAGDPIVACPEEGSQCTAVVELTPGAYEWEVVLDSGVIEGYQLVTGYTVYTEPPFGNPGEGGGHPHDHG